MYEPNRFDNPYSLTATIPRHHRTVRFDNGEPCCTCTYNYKMTEPEKASLARRIAAALNATRHMSLDEMKAVVILQTNVTQMHDALKQIASNGLTMGGTNCKGLAIKTLVEISATGAIHM